MLAHLDENEGAGQEELGQLRLGPLPAAVATTTTTIADRCHPSPSASSRPRLRAPSPSSSTYRSDYKPSPVMLCDVVKAQRVGLGSERGGLSERALTSTLAETTAAAATRRRSSSPPRGCGDRAHCCHCRCSSSSAKALLLIPSLPPRSLSPAKGLSRAFDEKENASSLRQKQQQQLLFQQRSQQQQRSSRVSGSALSDALASFREKERNWLSEKAAFRREADAARRASLLSEGLRAKEATARRHAEEELRAARAAIRRRDDDDAAEKEESLAALAAASAAAESRVRSAEYAASMAAAEAAEAREKVIVLEQELADERSRRGGEEAERERALKRADAAVAASRRVAGKFAFVVEREAERASGAERRLQDRVIKACGVDLSSIAEEEEEEEEEESSDEAQERDEEGEQDSGANEASDRDARLPPISFTL